MSKIVVDNNVVLDDIEQKECDEAIKRISDTLLNGLYPIGIQNYDEEIILKSLISEFYSRNTAPSIVEYIIEGVYNCISSSDSFPLKFFKEYLNMVNSDELNCNKGLEDLEKQVLLKYSNIIDETVSEDILYVLRDVLRTYEDEIDYKINIDSDNYISLDKRNERVKLVRILQNKNESWVNVINAYPEDIIIHDNPIIGRNFSISWKNKYSKKPYIIEKKSISEMCSELKESGWVLNKQRLEDTISAIINISIIYELASIRDYIEEDGFYYNEMEGKMIVNYELHEPMQEEVLEALDIIEDLSTYFKGSEIKLATCIKWGLVSAFSFARKQIGADFFPYLFLFGKAGSGKSTIGKIVLYLWSYPSIDNNLEGSSFDTEFRIGEQLMQGSFPLVVNEPAGAFKKRSVKEMLKSTVQSLISRSKQQGNKFVKKPAYAPVLFTANHKLPSDDGLIRRFISIAFTHDEKKDKHSQRKFNEKFHIDTPRESPLVKLHGLSNYVANIIMDNPELLKRDWDELGNLFIIKAYDFVGKKAPKWLLQYENMNNDEDNENMEVEEIRNFLLNIINDKYNRKIQLNVYEQEWSHKYTEKKLDEFYSNEIADSYDFYDRVHSVISQHLIPFMSLNIKSGVEYVNFNTLLVKELFDNLEISSASNLKSISELLNWDYGYVSVNGEKGTRMYVEFEKFLNFLYPNYEIIVDENDS